jgi:hypothetical protein
MVLQCKKGKLFITGEVFPLDIGLLMGDNHIKGPWRTHSYKFIMVMSKKY